ncbi:chlorophyllase-1 isoform X1 [Lingula anatina]|uniref:Chlorophyllase-1 isoform X1 n=1 Tax=Lingula anatina TaxID=7574 RepID=A0A1S3K1M7_LINAN|nr:chlorophyllase-1 isoform X1 [Lingula anatina]XP_013416536.1 chlorophyllase-1 isoform X1 [Lingula anatina]XP_013416537.1 chlorophyllase-1 isoform X1 [Lingula anatina]XP_013416538.1 chlorophyllase-1 isoform X1 [Lingula anatina]XP_013416539.1 chlorophyllase-1 isoform X1 [Lingula anatina]XP_013416540.1 chlorophyllase-1 isoform X1 [Lingula anatina]XP_013416541.1 chlorophyllase-1 isoform X1 [Lingula anatina]XP_013416542.1 chlorophyllase-1 isoform X1 [Lingula anatina]|eukprot:XP_013416535.1 chlorophyllase-1 isoform X1 [Lingula anatina]
MRYPDIFCGVLFALFLLVSPLTTAVFVNNGNPFVNGPLNVTSKTLSILKDKSPIKATAYFPTVNNGSFGVIFFVGGFYGVIWSENYSDILSKIASHGFIVIGMDPDWPADRNGLSSSTIPSANYRDMDKYFKMYDWLKGNLAKKLNLDVAWDRAGTLCHSAGCDNTLQLVMMNQTIFKASVWLEPFSASLKTPINFTHPGYAYGTQLSEEIIPCAIPGYDYRHYYKMWKCPRIMTEISTFGHCDLLNPTFWEACRSLPLCKITKDIKQLPEYRMFVQGMATAFLMGYLQNNTQALQYITRKELWPLDIYMEIDVDIKC